MYSLNTLIWKVVSYKRICLREATRTIWNLAMLLSFWALRLWVLSPCHFFFWIFDIVCVLLLPLEMLLSNKETENQTSRVIKTLFKLFMLPCFRERNKALCINSLKIKNKNSILTRCAMGVSQCLLIRMAHRSTYCCLKWS